VGVAAAHPLGARFAGVPVVVSRLNSVVGT